MRSKGRTKRKAKTGTSPAVTEQIRRTAKRIREIEREALAKLGRRRRPEPTTGYERSVVENVEKFGWHCTSVVPAEGSPDGVPFSYTVGLHYSFGQPEFLVLGL